ncbi:MAG: DUF72 domain-containing protein [Ferroplasma sp.]
MEFKMGSSGWSYRSWNGVFYPMHSRPDEYLHFYSSIFNTVEVDSTFYGLPHENTVKAWYDAVPDNFLFSLKMPRSITHEKHLLDVKNELQSFFNVASMFSSKLGIILIQTAPDMPYNYSILDEFIKLLPDEMRFAIEFRHRSWFADDIYSLLRKNGIAMVWSLLNYIEAPPVMTSDFLYVRMVGDHSMPIDNFNGVKIDRKDDIKRYATNIKNKGRNAKIAYIYSNNHFQGFSPATINFLRNSLGLNELEFNNNERQRTLF